MKSEQDDSVQLAQSRPERSTAKAPSENSEASEEDGAEEAEPVDPEAIEELSAANLAEFIELNLDLVFQGDVGAGHRVRQAKASCKRASYWKDEDVVDWAASIHRNQQPEYVALRKAWRAEQSPEIFVWWLLIRMREFLPGNTVLPAGTEQETVDKLAPWVRACREVPQLFSLSLRDKLEAQAHTGNAAARFLYATWAPEEAELADAMNRFVAFQTWERKALTFTKLNLESGQPAGLMAYALSFRDGLFTGSDPRAAFPLFLAALDCGFPAPDMQAWLEIIVEELDERAAKIFLHYLQEADRHKRRCKR